jgi:hypothetical protein
LAGEKEQGERGIMCTPVEAAKDNQYRLLCDGMLRGELLPTQAAGKKHLN